MSTTTATHESPSSRSSTDKKPVLRPWTFVVCLFGFLTVLSLFLVDYTAHIGAYMVGSSTAHDQIKAAHHKLDIREDRNETRSELNTNMSSAELKHNVSTPSIQQHNASTSSSQDKNNNYTYNQNTPQDNTNRENTTTLGPLPKNIRESNISIVVHLRGELGNHLGMFAYAYCLQQELLERYHIHSHFVLKHQTKGKWKSAKRGLQTCFPSAFAHLDFSAANTGSFKLQMEQQQQLYSQNASLLNNPSKAGMDYLKQILLSKPGPTHPRTDKVVTEPFLVADGSFQLSMIDKYYDQIRKLYAFDSDACCAQLPNEDEAVFHFRNFATELKKNEIYKSRGFKELSPNLTANELLGHLPNGTRIAMTSRFAQGNKRTNRYVKAFEGRGYQVRVITNQTGTQDFCFLMNAQSDLAGSGRSTFFQWATWLRNYTDTNTTASSSTAHGNDNSQPRRQERIT